MSNNEIFERLVKLESQLEKQQDIIERQRERISELETEDSGYSPVVVTDGGDVKVIGQISADGATGVLGKATGSGTTYGIRGEVTADSGYGLKTPDDASIDGTAEVGGLGGTLTNNDPVSDLTGTNLDIREGALSYVGAIYQNKTFNASGTTWDPVGTLSSETKIEVTVDMESATSGRVRVDVDGSQAALLNAGTSVHRIFSPTNTLTVHSLDGWGHGTSFDVSSQALPVGVAFEDDGSKLFTVGTSNIYSYDLSTPWDLSTASFDTSYDFSSQTTFASDLAFKPDGSKVYIIASSTYAYDLSSPWDIATASFDTSALNLKGVDLTFKPDGTKVYTIDSGRPYLRSYSLSTPWDVTTATIDEGLVRARDGYGVPGGVAFNSDGSKLFVAFFDSGTVDILTLSTAWDISTVSQQLAVDVESVESTPESVTLKPDDTRLFICGTRSGSVHSYNKTYSGVARASIQRD